MTREEIEKALLTTGVVDIAAGDETPIELSAPGRRLANIIFDCLRSSTVDELSKDTEFFDALEAAFLEGHNFMEPDSGAKEDASETEGKTDLRTWHLKKVEARGFGGLNAVSGDAFEFDMAGGDFCIEGQNGSGKSSLANAILFAMTGKIHRDQYGLWEDPAHLEPVLSDEGIKLGDWPPIATYPNSWESDCQYVDVAVTLSFGNETDDEEISATRCLHGRPGGLKHEAKIDPRLKAAPTLIEAALLMPMRIQHIRVPEKDDNSQLVGLIRQLIGLEPLLGVAEIADKLSYKNQRFLRYAKENDFQGKADNISKLLQAAQEEIKDLDTGIDLSIKVGEMKPIPENLLKHIEEAKKELDRRQANGFQMLESLAFDGFDPKESKHRQRLASVINRLHLDASRQNELENLPQVLRDIASLAKRGETDDFVALKSALREASADLSSATEWADRQREDGLLRLKAVAAGHFEDCGDPLCPLCEQPIGGSAHQDLVADLRALKTNAERAQTRLAEACGRIEQKVRSVAEQVVPNHFMQIEQFALKQSVVDQIRGTFVEASHIADSLPGFVEISQAAVDSAFEAVKEVEFGSTLLGLADGDHVGRLRRLLDHLESIVAAAEGWQRSRYTFREAWTRLFSEKERQSLIACILQYKGMVEIVEPYRSASENVGRALNIAADYNDIVGRQELRENIVQALKPLRKLRDLVNLSTRRTIETVSEAAKCIHGRIYNPEELTYEKTELSELRRKQSLTFRAKLGNDSDWRIDASLLANASWMRGILWSFVFAIREKAIKQSGYSPFGLMVLDDPQMTFDTRNLKGWVQFLGRSDELRRQQPCQLLVTTHSMPFALEMTAVPGIQMAAIETGQPWFKPAQVVMGDFAAIRYQRMMIKKSDPHARRLIADIRVLAETLLKHAIEPMDPAYVRRPEATLGRIVDKIAQRNAKKEMHYTDPVFRNLISVKSSNSDLFGALSEPHHSISETITIREAKRIYEFWKETLFPAIHSIWVKYRFLQRPIVGEGAAIPLPANCNHKPFRSTAVASVQPMILGRVSAYSDGRAASAIRIDLLEVGDPMNLNSLATYRLEKDTLSPVARIGDILLTRLDKQCRASNLVVEDRGEYRIARRWHEDPAASFLAVLAASSSNPREVSSAVISRAEGANRRKIVGILFTAERLQQREQMDPNAEATELDTNNGMVASLVADTIAFEVQGNSAEPIALDKQYLLAKPEKKDLAGALVELDGKPVIAEDSEGGAFFKRLRRVNPGLAILESLDKTGSEGPISRSVDPEGPSPLLTCIREVVGVVFDKM